MIKKKDAPVKIAVRNLFKIFGPDPQSVLPLITDGIDKAEIQQQTGHVLGLNNINIDMKSGNITVVMGLSGSGKSTLIRHFNRLIEPTAGQILVDDQDVLTFNQQELREMRQNRMSMVFQKFALLPHRTVLDNAILALETRGEDINQAKEKGRKWLKEVGLDGFENSYPHQLSGGMQQRVGLARALTSDSDVMLMDEAFSALDPLIRTTMQDLLLHLQETLHKTIVFISHDLDEALKLADHLVILKDGYVVQQGEPQAILLNPADPYIEDFISDINRARVLRVGSIMQDGIDVEADGAVDEDETLENLIAQAEGRHDKSFFVTRQNKKIGHVTMPQVLKALVRVRPEHEITVK